MGGPLHMPRPRTSPPRLPGLPPLACSQRPSLPTAWLCPPSPKLPNPWTGRFSAPSPGKAPLTNLNPPASGELKQAPVWHMI